MTSNIDDPLLRRIRKHAIRRKLSDVNCSLNEYKEFLSQEEEVVLRYHRKGDSGLRVAKAKSVVIDVLLESLFHKALQKYTETNGPMPCEVALLALGGYGRAELCPLSDIDLMFLYPANLPLQKLKEIQTTMTDVILYTLWDLNLKVGHSSRTPREAIEEAKVEVQSKNAMLESRLITGSQTLYAFFQKKYRSFLKNADIESYISTRIDDEAARHAKFGNSPLIQEPEIKNGPGGLRDYQNILWILRLKLNKEADDINLLNDYLNPKAVQQFNDAYNFLLKVRNELHFQNTRATDLLNLEKQPKIAWELGYRQKDFFRRVEFFMQDYYKHAQNIWYISRYLEKRLALDSKRKVTFRSVIESRQYSRFQSIDGFVLRGGTLHANYPDVFQEDPERLIRVFRHAQQLEADLDFELMRLITDSLDLITEAMRKSKDANTCFRSILQSVGNVYPALSNMHRSGVLQKFIPEFKKLYCLVQHEYYHRYTADQHTLDTIRALDDVFNGAYERETGKYKKALHDTSSPGLLYIILLLHDIGKGDGIKGHDKRGAEIAVELLERFNILQDKREKILFIIRNHLEMARFWQRYDIDDPDTAVSFSQVIENPENLHYLYVHTYCDARGTSAALWNSYKDSLHTQLYRSTLAQLGENLSKEQAYTMTPKTVISQKIPSVPAEEIEAHYNLLPERYFIYNNPDEISLHVKLVNSLLQNINDAESLASLVPVIDWRDDLNLSMTVVNIVTWDRAGLFCKLAGAFSVAGLSIVSSKAISRADHITIDTFYVCEPDGGVVQNKKTIEIFKTQLTEALLHNKDLMPDIDETAKKLTKPSYLQKDENLHASIPPKIDVYHELSLKRTIIEVQATDRLGLLYTLSKAIYNSGFDITFARVATERTAAIDTFYIEPIKGQKIDETASLIALRKELTEIIETMDKDDYEESSAS